MSFFFAGGDNFLGINAEEVTRENMGRYNLSGEPRGVGVREVIKGSPAERAGLREGDVIIRYDGEPVSSIRKLNRLIDESEPEHQARLTVRRGGSEQEVTVTLGKHEESFSVFEGEDWRKQQEEWKKQGEEWKKNSEQWRKQAEEMRERMKDLRMDGSGTFQVYFGRGRRIGVATENLGKQLADYFGVPHGVLVTSVSENSPASKAGLKAGDIITEADGERVEGAGALTRALNKKEDGDVTLTVVRDRQRRTVRVTPEKGAEAFEFSPGAFALEAPRAALAPLRNMRIAPMRNTRIAPMRVAPMRIAPMRLNVPLRLSIPMPRVNVTPRPLRVRPLTTRRIL
jgi:serine protease Do